ncbi:hypothetical protein [Gordonibacter sp. Marseille-P4307]|uniref:hypothetical protein n=1 Tax=Gordonibacter sp. Marseille-P4307 TaxID=2161815 RepID=UPI000F546482|nr:hypothetical protein [Gordonibacter sp. Marseille-P4307]
MSDRRTDGFTEREADAVVGDAHGYAVVYSISRDDGGTVIWSRNVFFDRIIDPSEVASVEIGGASIKPLA